MNNKIKISASVFAAALMAGALSAGSSMKAARADTGGKSLNVFSHYSIINRS